MKYCMECGSEYQDAAVTECADCPGQLLVDAATMRARGIPLPGEQDSRNFVRVATAEDPMTAEQMVGVLEDAKIPVLARPRRGGTVDLLTTGVVHPWWEILVTEEHQAQAAALLGALAAEQAREEAQGAATIATDEGSRGA